MESNKEGYKICSKCKIEKLISKFHIERGKYVRPECKECKHNQNQKNYWDDLGKRKEKSLAYRIGNREEIRARDRKSYEENKEERQKRKNAWYHNNKDAVMERSREGKRLYQKKRRKEDPAFRLRGNISRQINTQLKKQNSKKECSILKKLPCTMGELKQHIENQFESWMEWGCFGKTSRMPMVTWQLDHRIPQSKLPYSSMDDENFQKCWALKNLRPYDSYHNIRKKDKLDYVEEDPKEETEKTEDYFETQNGSFLWEELISL